MIPLVLIGIVGIFYIDYSNIDLMINWNFEYLTAAVALTFFAFQGMESATVASDKVDGDINNTKKATFIGTLITSIIYISCSFVALALLSPEKLAVSASPFADASGIFLGPAAKYFIAIGAIFSTLGALNGWILLQGHIPMAAAQDKLFPLVFGIKNQNGSPARGIIITSLITSFLLTLNYIKGLVSMFTLMISLSTLAVLVPYIFSVAAFLWTLRDRNISKAFSEYVITILAFCFLFWVMSGSGWETILYGFSFIFTGFVFYLFTIKIKINF